LEVAVEPEETITVLVLKVVIGPGGDDEAERVIVPAKLLMLDTDMVLLRLNFGVLKWSMGWQRFESPAQADSGL